MNHQTKIRAEQIVELRDVYRMSFGKIGKIYGISRQGANQLYHRMKPDAPRRQRRFKKEEVSNADHQN